MSVIVEIENSRNLEKARHIIGVTSNDEAVELALERFVRDYEPQPAKEEQEELPESFWDDLFSQPKLPGKTATDALLADRDEAMF